MGLMSFIYFFVRLKGYYFEGFVDSWEIIIATQS
jgi:hypothetical protein